MGSLLCLVQGDQYPVVIMETEQNFDNVLQLGYYCVLWIFGSQLVGHLKLTFQQLAMKCETKTKDTVFIDVPVSIQYCDLTDKASETLYKLSNTKSQLQVYDFDVIRACIPKLNLDDAYGFKVVRTLIVDTEPDEGNLLEDPYAFLLLDSQCLWQISLIGCTKRLVVISNVSIGCTKRLVTQFAVVLKDRGKTRFGVRVR